MKNNQISRIKGFVNSLEQDSMGERQQALILQPEFSVIGGIGGRSNANCTNNGTASCGNKNGTCTNYSACGGNNKSCINGQVTGPSQGGEL